MSRIDAIFESSRSRDRKVLVPFVVAAHPIIELNDGLSQRTSLAATISALEHGGASVIEVGFPFSDPIADGPVIAAAMHESLLAGVTPDWIFDQVESVRPICRAGLVAMVSYSLIHKRGEAAFVERSAESGFDGLLVPDLPIDESEGLRRIAHSAGLSMPFLIAPSTPASRAAQIAQRCTGFVYLLARAGITGDAGRETSQEAALLQDRVTSVRSGCETPIGVGFGINSTGQAALVARDADAVIIGSELVRRMRNAVEEGMDPVLAAAAFAREFAAAINP